MKPRETTVLKRSLHQHYSTFWWGIFLSGLAAWLLSFLFYWLYLVIFGWGLGLVDFLEWVKGIARATSLTKSYQVMFNPFLGIGFSVSALKFSYNRRRWQNASLVVVIVIINCLGTAFPRVLIKASSFYTYWWHTVTKTMSMFPGLL